MLLAVRRGNIMAGQGDKMATGIPWTREHLLIVFRHYWGVHFGTLDGRNPRIRELAARLGRTPGSVAMKAANFASLDPGHQRRGVMSLKNASKADKALWAEFQANSELVAAEAEEAYQRIVGSEHTAIQLVDASNETSKRMPQRQHKPPGETNATRAWDGQAPEGPTDAEQLVRARRVQSFFRTAVLISYQGRCALSGLALPELLTASHIIPWTANIERRADPSNGLALNTLYDRAFDRGLITFDDNLCVLLSSRLREYGKRIAQPTQGRRGEQLRERGTAARSNGRRGRAVALANDDRFVSEFHAATLLAVEGRALAAPFRSRPDRDALEYHRRNVFQA